MSDENPISGPGASDPGANTTPPAGPETALTTVNPQIVDAVTQGQTFVLGSKVVVTQADGKAYQSVAQSMAIAVQDATDYLRNVSSIQTTAIGKCTKLMIAQGTTTPWSSVIQESQKILADAIAKFADIGKDAGEILSKFPSGAE